MSFYHYEIYDKIWVYKGALADHEVIYEILPRLEESTEHATLYAEWKDWYTFGRINEFDNGLVADDSGRFALALNGKDENKRRRLIEELYVFNSLRAASERCINDYVRKNNVEIPDNSFFVNPSVAWYKPNVNTNNHGLTMNFHTDYGIGEWWWPGEKFLITSTIYPNDDYEGGDIIFYANDEVISYKPSAGDVVVFPSGDMRFPGKVPYFHGVKMTSGGKKYIIRAYLKYREESNKELWSLGKMIFGDQEWADSARSVARGKNMLSFDYDNQDNILMNTIDVDDCVKRLYG